MVNPSGGGTVTVLVDVRVTVIASVTTMKGRTRARNTRSLEACRRLFIVHRGKQSSRDDNIIQYNTVQRGKTNRQLRQN